MGWALRARHFARTVARAGRAQLHFYGLRPPLGSFAPVYSGNPLDSAPDRPTLLPTHTTMKAPFFRTALLIGCVAVCRLAAADDVPPPPPAPTASTMTDDQKKLEEAIRIRLAEHTLKKGAKATVATTAETTGTPPAAAATNPGTPPKPAEDPATQLQRVEVNQTRVTELAIKLHEKDLEIAREKRNATPTTLDTTLNGSGVSHTLAVLGGASGEDRARVAQERVGLLEAEKDLIEAIAQAKTKEEKDELEKTLNDLKTMRRELDRAPRDERK